MINDIDPFARADANGIIQAESNDAWMLRLEEWLNTPVGSIYGAPAWGNTLQDFVHEPLGSVENHAIEVAMESSLAKKMRDDLPGIGLQGIRCDADGVDYVTVSFLTKGGRYQTKVLMNQG